MSLDGIYLLKDYINNYNIFFIYEKNLLHETDIIYDKYLLSLSITIVIQNPYIFMSCCYKLVKKVPVNNINFIEGFLFYFVIHQDIFFIKK